MKVIIAGSRNFDNYAFLKEKCDIILKDINDIEIVSGTANGADKLGEKYAFESNFNLKQFPANWKQYGNSAGYVRNKKMAKYADMLIAFWDGESNGTRHMINLAIENNLKVHTFVYNGNKMIKEFRDVVDEEFWNLL